MRHPLWSFACRRLPALILAVVVASLWSSGWVWADQQITDPKRWCDGLMTLLAEKNVDKAADEFQDSAGGRLKRQELDTALASLSPLLERAGHLRTLDPILEKRYGRSVADFTYAMFFDSIDLFFRCRLHKRGDYWSATGFVFNTNLDNLDVP